MVFLINGKEGMAPPKGATVVYVAHDTGLIGGAERQLLELLRGLDRTRFKPLLVCLEEGGPVARGAQELGVPVYHMGRTWRWDLSVITRLRRLIRSEEARIVHAYLGLPGFYGAVAGKLEHRKVITTIRIAGPRRRFTDFSERIGFLISDRIISNSKAGVDYYFAHFPGRSKTVVIYNGYALSDFDRPARSRQELGLPAQGLLIGHVANLSYLKDYPTFLKSLPHVFNSHPDVHAVIVGDGAKRNEYENLARSLGIFERTLFVGHRADVLDLVKCFDVCVLASHPSFSEGLSNSIAEYMGMAKPVVATAVGGNPELVRDGINGFLARPGDPDDLARKILILLEDDDLRKKMGLEGRKFFEENLRLERMVNDTQKIYEELLQE